MHGTFDWDDEVETTDSEYTVLEPGEYTFIVTGMERKWFDGSSKLDPCKMAEVTLTVGDPLGSTAATITDKIYLENSVRWKVTQFFKSIGLVDPDSRGESIRFPWSKIIGKGGKCEVGNREYNGKTYNTINRYIVPDNAATDKPKYGGFD